VGKGTKNRMKAHWRNALSEQKTKNLKLRNKLQSILKEGHEFPIYEKWIESEDADYCLWMEIYLIDFIGRENLCNLTDGGEDPPRSSEISRKNAIKMVMSNKGRPSWNKGIPCKEKLRKNYA
jgi:hypothetical protein